MKYPTITQHYAEGDWFEREMKPHEKLNYAENRIASLETALRDIIDYAEGSEWSNCADAARAALTKDTDQ